MGAGRTTKDDIIDHSVGVEIIKNIGDYVNAGDVIAKLYVNSNRINYFLVNNAFKIDDKKGKKEPIIYGIVK